MSVDDRAYLSIGEVLALLKEEFPDVTISKIRFLESQGLLDPERTPSGYRKFYESDVERLRWILRQQRENFLPLKVIKGRLREGTVDLVDEAVDGGGTGTGTATAAQPAGGSSAMAAPAGAVGAAGAGAASPGVAPGAVAGSPPRRSMPVHAAASAAGMESLQVPRTGSSMTLAELANATGLEDEELRDLERYGLLEPRRVGSNVYYDEDALLVANLAAGFMRYGVEARHLRMYKQAGDREASFFEQVVMPMLKQRNPQARRQATDTLADLSRLGQAMRAAMLRQALRQYLEGP